MHVYLKFFCAHANCFTLLATHRRKMNRESARRTRVRKQQQMQSLESEVSVWQLFAMYNGTIQNVSILVVQTPYQLLQVAQLKSENVSKSECIRLLTKKVRGMTSDTRRLHLEYQLLMKYVGELTATCRNKEAAVLEFQNQIRHPGGIKHVAIPPAEQVCNQGLRLAHATQAAMCNAPAHYPVVMMCSFDCRQRCVHHIRSVALSIQYCSLFKHCCLTTTYITAGKCSVKA